MTFIRMRLAAEEVPDSHRARDETLAVVQR